MLGSGFRVADFSFRVLGAARSSARHHKGCLTENLKEIVFLFRTTSEVQEGTKRNLERSGLAVQERAHHCQQPAPRTPHHLAPGFMIWI